MWLFVSFFFFFFLSHLIYSAQSNVGAFQSGLGIRREKKLIIKRFNCSLINISI